MMDEKKETSFDEMIKAVEALAVHESAINQIITLAHEYGFGSITSERFSKRVLEILKAHYEKK